MALGHGETYEPGVVNSVCSFCSCYCSILSGILRFGLAPHLMTSDTVFVTDYETCTDCVVCVERCQFGARSIENDSMVVKYELCFGCGMHQHMPNQCDNIHRKNQLRILLISSGLDYWLKKREIVYYFGGTLIVGLKIR